MPKHNSVQASTRDNMSVPLENRERKPDLAIGKMWFHEIQRQLKGISVVVDANAASANMAILLSKSPEKLIVVNRNNLKKAQSTYPNTMFLGESEDKELSKLFDCDNRLESMYSVDATDRNIIWMSINGSPMFEETMRITKDGEVIAGSFHNAAAVASYLKKKQGIVNLVMAGDRGIEVPEDFYGTYVIEQKLLGERINWKKIKSEITAYFKKHYPDEIDTLPWLLDHPDEFDIVPKFVLNNEGFIEVIRV